MKEEEAREDEWRQATGLRFMWLSVLRFFRHLGWRLAWRCRACGGELSPAHPFMSRSPYECLACGWREPEDDDEH